MIGKINYSALYQKLVRGYSSIPISLLAGHTFPPLQVFIEVTYHCNLSCDFCQFLQTKDCLEASEAGQRTELTISELKKVVRGIPRTAIISFSGGEPFVKKDFLALLEFASSRNKTHIFTNGTRITVESANTLVEIAAPNVFASGLVLLGVSLEGLETTHNQIVNRPWAFQKTITALETLQAAKSRKNKKYPLIELKTVISERNASQLYDLYSIAKDYKVDVFNIMTMNTLSQANRIVKEGEISHLKAPPKCSKINPKLLENQLRRIQSDAAASGIQIRTTPQGFDFAEIINYYSNGQALRKYRCYYPWYGAGISAFGDIWICPYVMIGNVKDANGPLRTLTNNPKARKFRNELKQHKIFPGCWGCCMLVQDR